MDRQTLENILSTHKEYIQSNGLLGVRADLQWANLREADLREADLRLANLRGANLQGANLREANLHGANLHGANLREANLREANLQGANLQGANLRRADLREANLQGANLLGADLPKGTYIIYGHPYFISIVNDIVRVGCRQYTVEGWFDRSEHEIARMGRRSDVKLYPRLLDLIDFYVPDHGQTRPEWVTKQEG